MSSEVLVFSLLYVIQSCALAPCLLMPVLAGKQCREWKRKLWAPWRPWNKYPDAANGQALNQHIQIGHEKLARASLSRVKAAFIRREGVRAAVGWRGREMHSAYAQKYSLLCTCWALAWRGLMGEPWQNKNPGKRGRITGRQGCWVVREGRSAHAQKHSYRTYSQHWWGQVPEQNLVCVCVGGGGIKLRERGGKKTGRDYCWVA